MSFGIYACVCIYQHFEAYSDLSFQFKIAVKPIIIFKATVLFSLPCLGGFQSDIIISKNLLTVSILEYQVNHLGSPYDFFIKNEFSILSQHREDACDLNSPRDHI